MFSNEFFSRNPCVMPGLYSPVVHRAFAMYKPSRAAWCSTYRGFTMTYTKKILALGTAAAIAVSATTFASAAPIGVGTAPLSLKNAEMSDVINVSRRGRRNTAIAIGAGALLLGGALAAGAYSHPHYYYAPAPAPARCWVQTGPYRGQGYWAYC
jgi:hypothetical protein